ncbi:MAG: hypothetical protein WC222_11460 [Parachlamydiales bacterium]|jgi:hypothetical protein
MEKFKLTLEILDDPKNQHQVIAKGETSNDEKGLYMTEKGGILKWVLKVGTVGDWAIYCHWNHMPYDYVVSNGDKVYNRENIENIIDFDDEVWKRYRY